MMKISVRYKKTTLKDIKKFYKSMIENQPSLQDSIINDLKEVGLLEINNSISSDAYKASEPLAVVNEENRIGIRGEQAFYDEYGTGTMGAENPHPEKDNAPIPLNPYNSGKTIRASKTKGKIPLNDGLEGAIYEGELYWSFMFNGKKIYTKGRPAGMHIYKAKQKIKESKKNIIEKRVGEFLSKR